MLNALRSLLPIASKPGTLIQSDHDAISELKRGASVQAVLVESEVQFAYEWVTPQATSVHFGFHVQPVRRDQAILNGPAESTALKGLRAHTAKGQPGLALNIERYRLTFAKAPELLVNWRDQLADRRAVRIGKPLSCDQHAAVLKAHLSPPKGSALVLTRAKGGRNQSEPRVISDERPAFLGSLIKDVALRRPYGSFWLWIAADPSVDLRTGEPMANVQLTLVFDQAIKSGELHTLCHAAWLNGWIARKGTQPVGGGNSRVRYEVRESDLNVNLETLYCAPVPNLRPGPVVFNRLWEPINLSAFRSGESAFNHGVLLGQPGSGKHYLAKTLIEHHAASNNPCYVLQARERDLKEPWLEHATLVQAITGLDLLAALTPADDEASELAAAASWVFCLAPSVAQDQTQHAIVEAALSESLREKGVASLETLPDYVSRLDSDLAASLRAALAAFTGNGVYSSMFTGPSLKVPYGGVTVFPEVVGMDSDLARTRELTIALLLERRWRIEKAAKPALAYMRDYARDPGDRRAEVWRHLLGRTRLWNGAWMHRIHFIDVERGNLWVNNLVQQAGWLAGFKIPNNGSFTQLHVDDELSMKDLPGVNVSYGSYFMYVGPRGAVRLNLPPPVAHQPSKSFISAFLR